MVSVLGPGESSNRRRRRRTAAFLATVVFVTAGTTACGRGSRESARVSLVPSTTAKGQTWQWTPACRVGPQIPSGCAASGPVVGTAELAGDAWNLGDGAPPAGSVSMSVSSSGSLEVNGDFAAAPPCTKPACIAPQANTWVRGYPSVLYGVDQCHAATSPPQSAHLQLPANVASIPSDLVGTATYDLRRSEATYDIAYDMWLNASDTKTPCTTDGTVEVMVWTAYNDRALLPGALQVGKATVPFAVNGTVDPGDQAWSVYVNNVFRNGHTVPWGGTVWLVLDGAHTVTTGTVSVDLSTALAAVGGLLENNYGWTNFRSSYWLDTLPFGIEFGPEDANPYGSGRADFSWNLTSYCLEVATTVAAARC